jgi:DNA-binding transcriptional ArsR family regulator
VAAFRTWQTPRSAAARRHWKGFFENATGRSEWPLLRALSLAPTGAIPDFLAPPPAHPFVRFEDEIAELRATPITIVAAELRASCPDIAPPPGREGKRACARVLAALADELTLFWQLVVAPAWPRVRHCLEAEVVYRSRVLAFGGTHAVLAGLHRDVTFDARGSAGSLRVRTNGTPQRRAAGGGLLLVPSVFAWPDVYAVARPPWRPTLAYPAQGIAELWPSRERRKARDDEGLAVLVGAPRARVLRLLTRPRTTSDLAGALRSSPSAVSPHLTALWAGGFLNRARNGRRVFYSLSERGHAVLRAAD